MIAVVGFVLASRYARAWPPGDTTGVTIQVQNMTRQYNVHVPASYDGAFPVPLVVDLHGWTSAAGSQQFLSGFDALSESAGFIVAYPEGYQGTGSDRSWNSGICCAPATTDAIDDVDFMRAMVADIQSQANIDPLRIYVTGLSNGAAMSHRLACEAPDLVAAAAPVAAPLFLQPFARCQPFRPISVLHFAGLTDAVVPYAGGESEVFPGLSAPSSPDSFAHWVAADGCGDGPPEIVEDLGNGASCQTHTACAAGVEAGFCSINGTAYFGHILYTNGDGVDVAQRAWSFMSQFTLPPALATTTCAPTPLPGCRTPAESGRAKLLLKDKTPDKGDAVTWKWLKGAATTLEDWGDPLSATGYAACVYDGASNLVMRLRAFAGDNCGPKPCWKALGTKGFKYGHKGRTPDGLVKLGLSAGEATTAKITLTAKGDHVPLPALGSLALPLRVQLQGNDLCWEATYSSPQVSTSEQFKALAD